MAYPALLTAPFPFVANFHSQETRKHSRANSFRFMAQSTTDAEAVVAELVTATASSAQNTSFSQRVGSHLASGGPYPTGSRATMKTLCIDSGGAVFRVSPRNWNTTIPVVASDMADLLLGTVSLESTPLVTALSAVPQNPATGDDIVTVQATIITKGW